MATSTSGKGAKGETASHESALRELFVNQVRDIYWGEKHLVKALPKMQKAASSEDLQRAFENHLHQTRAHAARLEEIFALLDEKAQVKKCEAIEGLVEEMEDVIDDTEEGTATRDVGLIIAAQKTEHYEIAAYGGLSQLARTLGHDQIAELLRETLDEEKDADELLTEIAEDHINNEAKRERETV